MRLGWKWGLAGLVTVAVYAVVAWLFTDFVAPLWVHDDAARLGWGLGAGAAAAGLAALGGKAYASAGPRPEPGPTGGGQVVENSQVAGGVTQVSGAGSVKITHRNAAAPAPTPAPPTESAARAETALPAGDGQRVSGTTTAGPVDQVKDVASHVEIEQ